MAIHKWEINENYFDDINTAEKAYFLGFLYADGYNNVKKHEIKIRLSIQDEELLIKFRDILYPNQDRPLQYSVRNGNHSYCELYVSNKRLSDSLVKHGCIQAKTFQVAFPYFISKSLYRHFIRGVFDGDGSICLSVLKSGEHKTCFSIIGYRPFIADINKVIAMECDLNENKLISYKGKDERIATLAFTGCRQCIRIREYLYQDANLFMKRKYEKFNKLGTDEWKTYQNYKINLHDRTIKLGDSFNPNEHTETDRLMCCNCFKTLSYKNKIYDINKQIYCSQCYNDLFSVSQKIKENDITISQDVAILKIKEYNVYFDIEDIGIVNQYKWHIENGRVISRTRKPKKCIYLNRLLMNATEGQSIAFIDGNHFNMRKSNLDKREHR